MTIRPSPGPVTKVRCLITRAGKTAHYNADLIFVAGIPTIVFEWDERPDGNRPSVTVALDPQYFHPLGWKEAEYMYEVAIQDPRKFD